MLEDRPNAKKCTTVEAPVVGTRAGLLGERLPFVSRGIYAFLLVPTAFVGKRRRLDGLPGTCSGCCSRTVELWAAGRP